MNIETRLLAGLLAMAGLAVFAQEAEEESSAGEVSVEAPKHDVTMPDEKPFHILPLCRRLDGRAEVKKPGSEDWAVMEEGKFYPLGSVFRTIGPDSQMNLMLGREASVELAGDSSFGTRKQQLGTKDRVIVLMGGTLTLKLPTNFPEGLIKVVAPGFAVENPAGESRYVFKDVGDGDEALVRCVTGVITVKGRHYTIPAMRAANEIKIRTSGDHLYTGLHGTSGDFLVELDQGMVQTMDIETQQYKVEPKTLVWKLSPKTAVRIQRAVPAIGSRMAVTVMTFDAAGLLKNRCAFTEGLFEVNTGEQGPASKKDREALEKRAAEASETVTVEEDVEDDAAGGDTAEAEDSDEE